MAIHRSSDADEVTVTFVLTAEDQIGPVSVVGSFNDWTPGAHPFEPNPDGSRSVTIVLPHGTDLFFRYLGPDGFWFDDPDADEITGDGSILRSTAETGSADSDLGTTDDSPVTSNQSAVSEPDGESAAEADHAGTHDETGERLETVTARINEAKATARELQDGDVIDPDASADTPDTPDAPDASGDEGPRSTLA